MGKQSTDTGFGRVSSSGFHNAGAGLGLADLQQAFPGALIGNGGYDGTTANDAIVKGDADAISFGRSYMSNPDLVERLRDNLPLAELPSHKKWFEPSDKTRAGKQRTTTNTLPPLPTTLLTLTAMAADPTWGYTEFGPYKPPVKMTRVLHMLGSPTSSYYEGLSIMYAH